MSLNSDCWIVESVRSPTGRRNGSLSGYHPAELGGYVLNGLLDRSNWDLSRNPVEDVFIGCVSQVGLQSSNIARGIVLASKLPVNVPGVTVDRQCGSSLQALILGYHQIRSGSHCLIVGGVESMSRVPLGSTYDLSGFKVAPELRYIHGTPLPPKVFEEFPMPKCTKTDITPLPLISGHQHPFSIQHTTGGEEAGALQNATHTCNVSNASWFYDFQPSNPFKYIKERTQFTEFHDRFQAIAHSQFIGADLLTRKYGLCACSLYEYARLSFHRANLAISQGKFRSEVIPMPRMKIAGNAILEQVRLPVQSTQGELETLGTDAVYSNTQRNEILVGGDGNTNIEFLFVDETSKAPPTLAALHEMSTNKAIPPTSWVTAPLASQISDGASMTLLASSAAASGQQTLGRIIGVSGVAGDPVSMLDAVPLAIIKAIQNANTRLAAENTNFIPLKPNDTSILYEINEAFASVPLVAARVLGIQPNRLNIYGGAIALGHPLGATGTKLISTVCRAAKDQGCKYAVVSVCEGGGMANAVVIEISQINNKL